MNRRYLLAALACFCVSWVCWSLYAWNGSYVDQDGVLHEQFGFIPLGYLFALAGLVLLVLSRVRSKQ
jgi:hypothetical protein